jgi:hypothetical protein
MDEALSRRSPVPLGLRVDQLMGDWWIVVTNISTAQLEREMTDRELI